MESSYLVAINGAYEQKSVDRLEGLISHFSLMADDLHTERIKNGGAFSIQQKTRIDELDFLITGIREKIHILRESDKQKNNPSINPSIS